MQFNHLGLFYSIRYFILDTGGPYVQRYNTYNRSCTGKSYSVYLSLTIYNILFYCLKNTVGTVIDTSFEFVNIYIK